MCKNSLRAKFNARSLKLTHPPFLYHFDPSFPLQWCSSDGAHLIPHILFGINLQTGNAKQQPVFWPKMHKPHWACAPPGCTRRLANFLFNRDLVDLGSMQERSHFHLWVFLAIKRNLDELQSHARSNLQPIKCRTASNESRVQTGAVWFWLLKREKKETSPPL